MKLQGGGPYQLNPGQITDDGELTMCLLQAFGETGAANTLDIDIIVAWYKKWVLSKPFDMEDTVAGTIGLLDDHQFNTGAVKKAASTEYKDVVSKYSLNRITPLAVWASEIDDMSQYR
jgi:ADP-ribosyl-[dinitrogen reductase] hydrolase